jgi:hypothetical protein
MFDGQSTAAREEGDMFPLSLLSFEETKGYLIIN